MKDTDVRDTARFRFHPAPLAGLWRVSRKPIGDARGFFMRSYCAEEFATIGLTAPLAQINHSASSRKGTVRGLHFQHPPHAETKVVTCIAGAIFDVALDLRAGSPTFLQWFGMELSAANQESLLIPPGFAHGFQTLQDDSEVLYLVDAPYSGAAEDGVNPFDPTVGIRWPVEVSEVSERDAQRAYLDRERHAGIALDGCNDGSR